MHNPYLLVAYTYIKRPFSSLKQSVINFVILFFFAFLFFDSGFTLKHDFPPVCLFPFIALSAYWAVHVKGQFADARASMTPGFRKVHIVVALITGIVFVIILPGLAAPLIGWQSLGFISVSTFLFGIILWYILHPGRTFFFFMLGGFLFIQQKPVFSVIEQVFFGKKALWTLTFLGVGAVLSITGSIRLFLLNEEKPEYHLNLKKNKDGVVQMSGLQWQKLDKSRYQGWWRWLVSRLTVRMIYHARHAPDSCWSRIHRWDYSGLFVWSALLYAVIFNLILTIFDFFSGTDSFSTTIFPVNTVIPILMTGKQRKAKRSFLSRELMMPVRRDAYLRQTGMLLACRQFIWWGVLIAVSIAWMFTKAVNPAPEFLIYSVSYSLMTQIWFFGLTVFFSSFRSSVMSLTIMLIALIFSAMNVTALGGQVMILWRPFIMIFGGQLAVTGLLLAWWGYSRWLAADFDQEFM